MKTSTPCCQHFDHVTHRCFCGRTCHSSIAEKNINDTGYAGLDDFSTTDTSDWRERFRKLFSCECMLCQEKEYPFETTRLTMEAFIEREIERAREEGFTFGIDKKFQDDRVQKAIGAEQLRIIGLAEAMKVDYSMFGGSAAFNEALDALITKIKEV